MSRTKKTATEEKEVQVIDTPDIGIPERLYGEVTRVEDVLPEETQGVLAGQDALLTEEDVAQAKERARQDIDLIVRQDAALEW